jgi:hypothetical protein
MSTLALTLAPHFGFGPPVLPTPSHNAIRDSAVPPAQNEVVSDETLLFDYSGSDISSSLARLL